jgi:hypothetical protein
MRGARGEARCARRAARGMAAAIIALTARQSRAFDAQVGWTPVQSVAGYRLYVRQGSQAYGAGLDVGLPQTGSDGVVRYVDHGLPSGIVTYFAVTAYNASGGESARSNELSVLVTATPALTLTPSAAATPSRTPTGTATRTTALATATVTRAASTTAVATATRTASPTTAPTTAPPASPTPTPTATPAVAFAVSISTSAHAKPGVAVSVPIRIAAGSNIQELAVVVDFDPTVVAVQNVELSTTAGAGTLASDFAIPGALVVTASLTQPLSAGGAVVNVFFTAVGACRASTALHIASCVLDGGAVGCAPSDGRIAVRCVRTS